MDDETELSEEYAIEYDEPEESQSLVRRVLTTVAGMVMAAAAGYLIGWTISIMLDRIGGSSGA